MERETFVEKPSKDETFLDFLIQSCEVEHGNQEDEDTKFLFLIVRHRWDVDRWLVHEYPIYDTHNEKLMEKI